VTRAEDIVEFVGRIGELAPEPARSTTVLDGLSDDERRVYEALPGRGAVTVEEIAVAAGVSPGKVLGPLAMLELAGLTERHDGQWRIVRRRGDGSRRLV
jgi:DNA processing protein